MRLIADFVRKFQLAYFADDDSKWPHHMRFTEFGPKIPNDLLDARDAGDVVFLCGAGVSIPAGLPDFFNLTADVARRLGVQPESDIGRVIELARQRRTVGVSTQQDGPISFDGIFTRLTRSFGVTQVESEVVGSLARARRTKLEHHRALLDLARGPDGRQRLITTNFDRLFQMAQRSLRSYAPPHFPDLSRRDGFDGIVHLHGVLPRDAARRFGDPLGLVLSSADFGRAYLAEAWATRFICELLDRYIVVLLGYRADDPPVRYLLEGLSLSGRIREHRLYAFASGEVSQIEADWRERGVTAIVYDPAEQHRHLWDSIHGWAERARDPATWRNRIATFANAAPQKLKPFERGQVAALCGSNDGAQAFASSVPPRPAEWLCVFDAACRYWTPGRDVTFSEEPPGEIDPLDVYGLDDDPPRPQVPIQNQDPIGIDLLAPLKTDDLVAHEAGIVTGRHGPTSRLNARLFHMARWIQSVMASPTAVWWAASRGVLHDHLRYQLSWALDHDSIKFDPVVRQAWRLVLDARNTVANNVRGGWWGIQSQIEKDGWTTHSLREFADATRPRITAQRPWSNAPVPPDGSSEITLSRIAHFDVAYPKLIESIGLVPDADLAAVVKAVRHNLELAGALESEISQDSLRLPTLYPENKPGEHHYSDSEDYYVTFANLYQRLAALDPPAARREYQHWDAPSRFFVALRIRALADPAIVTAAEVARALRRLDRDTFWGFNYSRELLLAIRVRWPTFNSRDRAAVESKLLQGPAKLRYETGLEYRERRARLSAERLVWMGDAGLKLSRSTIARLAGLKKAIPRWRDSWAKGADDSHEGRISWVKRETDPSPVLALPLSRVIARCDELAKREFQTFTDHDPFRGLVETTPQRAMAVLDYEARRGNYPQRYWSRLLSAWPKKATPRRTALLAKTLSSMPLPVLLSVRHELGRWILAQFAQMDSFDRKLAQSCFDRVIEALEQGGPEIRKSSRGKTSVGGVEIPSNRMGVNFAINSVAGDLAQALMSTLFARKPRLNQKIPADIKPRAERLLALPDEGGYHALTILARELHSLYLIDRGWSRGALLPRFDPAQPAAEAAWSGFLSAARMPDPALFRELKRSFLQAIAASPRWTCDELTKLADVLVLALEPAPRGRALLTAAEGRSALSSAAAAIREHAISFLRTRVGQRQAWNRLVVPFFRSVWPRERKYQTAATSHCLVLFLEDLDARFPKGVALVADFLVPSTDTDIFTFQFGSDRQSGRADLTTRFPRETLSLLSRIVDQTYPHPPYGLADVMTRLAEAAPELRHDERWQRLHRLALA